MPVATHHLTYFGVLINLRPDTHHQVHVHLMQAVGQCLGIGIVLFIELHGVPPIFAPILPVLNDDVNGKLLVAESSRRLENLIGRMEAFTTMNVSQRPLRHHRGFSCQVTERGDDLIGSADEYGIVNRLSYRRTEHGVIIYLLIVQHRLVSIGQLCRKGMTTSRKMDDFGSRRRQP